MRFLTSVSLRRAAVAAVIITGGIGVAPAAAAAADPAGCTRTPNDDGGDDIVCTEGIPAGETLTGGEGDVITVTNDGKFWAQNAIEGTVDAPGATVTAVGGEGKPDTTSSKWGHGGVGNAGTITAEFVEVTGGKGANRYPVNSFAHEGGVGNTGTINAAHVTVTGGAGGSTSASAGARGGPGGDGNTGTINGTDDDNTIDVTGGAGGQGGSAGDGRGGRGNGETGEINGGAGANTFHVYAGTARWITGGVSGNAGEIDGGDGDADVNECHLKHFKIDSTPGTITRCTVYVES